MAIDARTAEQGAALKIGFVTAAVILVGLLAIDRQGYWMDELGTWRYAGASGLGNWITGFLAIDNSDGQLPVYHFLAFLWSRAFGVEELGIRSLNAAFLLMSVIPVLLSQAVAWRPRAIWVALLLVNCFTWAYLNEARPYVLLMAGATYLMLALAWASRAGETPKAIDAAFVWFMLGAVVSFGASPVAAPVVLAAAGGVTALIGWRKLPDLAHASLRHVPLVVACVALALLVAALVLYSMAKGATPELANKTSIATVMFGGIEVLGGGGLVPDREALRIAGMRAIAGWQWGLLIAFAVGVAGMAMQALRSRQGRLVAVVLVVVVLSIVGVSIGGTIIGFRVVGRHIAFASPLLLFVVAMGISEAKSLPSRALALLLISCMLASTAIFRLSDRHGKDQTREAAALMRAVHDRGGTGWWISNPLLFARYRVDATTLSEALRRRGGGAPSLYVGPAEDWHALAPRLAPPQAILIERPENADADQFFSRIAANNGLRAHRLRGYIVYSAD